MFNQLIVGVVAMLASMSFALAMVDVNKADQAALDGVKGIGPAMSKKILEERKKGGNFKDWADFEKRVSGVGDKKALQLSQSGLTVGGQGKLDAPAGSKKEVTPAKVPAKDTKATDKKEVKLETKEVKTDIKK